MLLLFCVQSMAQVTVVLVDEVTGNPIQNVHVLVEKSSISFISNHKGQVQLTDWALNKNVIITHVSYDSIRISGSELKANAKVYLKLRQYELNEFSLTSVRVETMFHTSFHYVHDYELLNEKMVLLTFNKSLKKDAAITLCGLDQKILFEVEIGEEPIDLIKDYKGVLFLKTVRSTYRLPVIGDSIAIQKVNARDYNFHLANCLDSISNHIIFNDYSEYLPRMNYYAFHTTDSLFFKFKYVENSIVNKMQRWEYYELPLEEKRRARELANLIPNMDKKDVGAIFTGFHQTMYYEPVSAPLFALKDSIFIFDHSSSLLYKLVNFHLVDSVQISYHKSERFFRWKNEVLYDQSENKFHGLFMKNGYFYLKQINTCNGRVSGTFKVEKQFAESLKVHNGYVYYLHKKQSSPEKPFLYRELLSEKALLTSFAE